MDSQFYALRRPAMVAVLRIAFLSLFCAGSLLPMVPAANVAGTWDMEVNSQEGIARPSITLGQEGDRISGTYHGKMGDSPLNGTLSGNEIRFSVTLKFQEVSYAVVYSGTVTEDSMKGTAKFDNSGTGTWIAKRRKG
jgi:hypothetical protein